MLSTIFYFLVLFTLVVLFHELGHWAYAKRAGLTVSEFAIGFGPNILSYEQNGTLYALKLIPLGGMVKIEEMESAVAATGTNSYAEIPWRHRFGTIIAGPLMNILLAWLLLILIMIIVDQSLLSGLGRGTMALGLFLRELFKGLYLLFSGQVGVNSLAGPLSIAQLANEAGNKGLLDFLWFTSFISVNLAVINLLPLPALDGGRLFFLFLELIIRRPLNQRIENLIHTIGLVLLVGLVLYVTIFSDLGRMLS